MDTAVKKPSFSIPSILAVIAAILSFATGAFWGLLLALAAIFFGLIGILISLSPQVRGGFVSIVSLVAGVIGIVVAGFKALAYIL